MTLESPRAVLVHRRSEYEELLARHATARQVEFFLAQRGRSIAEVRERDELLREALHQVSAVIPASWRRGEVERADLSGFAFAPEDVVLVVGQDGLVANVAKYLAGQPVVGFDPEPRRNPGILVPHAPSDAAAAILRAVRGSCVELTMVEATTDAGETLRALNEVYVGQPGHQSARYELRLGDAARRCSPRAACSSAPGPAAPAGCGRPGSSGTAHSPCPRARRRSWRGSSARPGRARRPAPRSPKGCCSGARPSRWSRPRTGWSASATASRATRSCRGVSGSVGVSDVRLRLVARSRPCAAGAHQVRTRIGWGRASAVRRGRGGGPQETEVRITAATARAADAHALCVTRYVDAP